MLERCSQPPVVHIACHHSMELWRSIKETTGIELNHAQKWAEDAENDDEKTLTSTNLGKTNLWAAIQARHYIRLT